MVDSSLASICSPWQNGTYMGVIFSFLNWSPSKCLYSLMLKNSAFIFASTECGVDDGGVR